MGKVGAIILGLCLGFWIWWFALKFFAQFAAPH